MSRPDRRQFCLALVLTVLLLGMSASFSVDSSVKEELAEDVVVETRHLSNQSIMGFQSGSIFSNTSLTASISYTCVNMANNRMKCWGHGHQGQIGDGWSGDRYNATFVLLGAEGGPPYAYSHGSFGQHTIARMTDGTLQAWGHDGWGQLGHGHYGGQHNSPKPVSMPFGRTALHAETGMQTSCAVMDDQSLWCWGRNDPFGQVGNNNSTGDEVSVPMHIPIPNNQSVIALAGGTNFWCIILEDRSGMCWGSNTNGQLGNGVSTGHGANASWSNTAPEPITILPQNRSLAAISTGQLHVCAILDNGSVVCWGGNNHGQIGNGTYGDDGDSAVTTPQYVSLPAGRTAISIDSGFYHNCAILDDHSTWCWGRNNHGQLGDGTTTNSSTPIEISVPGLEFASISAGAYHTCAVATNASVWCWGQHDNGQLGLGGDVTGWPYDSDVPAWVNISRGFATDTVSMSNRDHDGDGLLSIFDPTPYGPPICPPGEYIVPAEEKCYEAAPGHYVPNSNMTYELECLAGTFQPHSGQSFCYEAAPGFYVEFNAAISAEICPIGSYQNQTGQTSCIATPAGHYSDFEGSIDPIPCDVGNYQPLTGQSNCQNSDAGHYVPIEGQAEQTACEAGTYQPGTGMDHCWRANVGYYVSQEGATEQADCQPGTYADVRGLAECKDADPGHYVATNLSVSQSACPPGQYQPLSGQDSCQITDAGHYNPASGSPDMVPCEQGYFQDQMGSTSCNPSQPGYHVPDTGSISQTECPVGTYSSENAVITCTDASLGYHVPSTGSNVEFECLAGTYTSEEGSSSCKDADPGHIVRFDGSSGQESCMQGTYQADSGTTDCVAAAPGYYVDSTAAIDQKACLPGTYQWDYGQTDCLESPPGKYSADSGSSTVDNCDPGTYQPDTGQASCLDADPGYYVDDFGATEQVPCEVGSFQNLAGQGECKPAEPGHMVSAAGSGEQTPCSSGTYQPMFGRDSCIIASVDYFVESAGSSKQTRCPSGESQPEEGQSSCIKNEDDSLPILAIAGAVIVVLAIGGFLMTKGKSEPAPKDRRRKPPKGARRRKKRPEGARKPRPNEATEAKKEED